MTIENIHKRTGYTYYDGYYYAKMAIENIHKETEKLKKSMRAEIGGPVEKEPEDKEDDRPAEDLQYFDPKDLDL
jgi:hypothetical protein